MSNMSYHCEVGRQYRREQMEKNIGNGNIIKEIYRNGTFNCLTDTGIVIIKNDSKDIIITTYVATQRELVIFYGGTKKIPPFLLKKVSHNESKYTKNGKTIWK